MSKQNNVSEISNVIEKKVRKTRVKKDDIVSEKKDDKVNIVIKDKIVGEKKDKTFFLIEGVKGGHLHKSKIATNSEVKKDMKSFSTVKKFVIAHDKQFLSSFKNINFDDLTPSNLTPLLTEKENLSTEKSGWTSWLFMTLVKRYYSNK
jgi:hypothetical protein